jgi:uncharacterized membrane protein
MSDEPKAPDPATPPPGSSVEIANPPPASSESQVVSYLKAEISTISGPLPPPELLKRYQAIIPNAPERFLAMVEEEGRHRRQLEKKRQDATIEDERAARQQIRRGQYCALALGIIGIVGGTISAALGSPLAASIIGGGGIAAIILAFMKRQDPASPLPSSESPIQPS